MPERGVGPNLGLATDPKDDSRIYAAFVDKGNGMDIRLAGSADRGQTWQALTVNNDGTAADQFDPAIAVDSDSNVYVSFYDTRLSSTFEAADVFLARPSTSNGFDNQRITTVSSNDSRQNAGRDFTANLGEHTALAITSGNVLVAWTDTRQNSEDIFVSMVTGTQHQVAVPKITWNIPPPITYGTPLGTAQLNASASVPGTFVYTPPPGTFPGAGTQTLAVTFTPSDTANFTTATASVQLTVVPAELTVTAISVSRFYGSPNPLLTGTTSGIVNGDNIVAAFTVNATVSSAPGTYTVIPVLSDPDKRLINYSVTLKTGIFEIRPAPLTVTANSASRLYASGNPALTGSIAGLVNGDNITATYTTTATTKSIVGKYPITAVISDGNKRLSNYTLTQIDGALEVVPAPLSVTANSASRFYGSANPVFTGLITGVVNSDNITAGYTTVATANSMPGTYPISPFMIDPDQRLSNYKVMATNGALTVIPAPIITLSATKPGSASAGNVQVSFGDQDLFSTSKSVTVTVGNIGTADLLISGLAVTGDGASEFALTNACAKTVAAGSNCIFTLRFTPSALGRRAAVITLTDNTGGYERSRQTVNTSGNGVLTYAAYATDTGCAAISFSGNASTDSFDSSHGTYAETKSNQRGDVAVNGNITLSGNATVNGTAYAVNAAAGPCKDGNPGISVSGKAAATGGYRPLPGPISFTTPAAVVPGRAAVRIKNDMALPPGKYGDITVERGAKLILSAGSYDVNSLNLNGASITVAGDGQVVLNIAGIDTDDNPIELSSKTRINPSGNPANFLVKYGGRAQIDLGGQLEFYGILYAPNAAVKLGGDADWYGAMVVDSLESSGTGALHYDRNLSVGFDSK